MKSAILLAGLAAAGTTIVREAVATRDHTERMLRARGVAVGTADGATPGGVAVQPATGGRRSPPLDQRVPGDVSAAAFWLVAAASHPDAELTLRDVGTNPTRRAIIDLLRRMGADIEERPTRRRADGLAQAPRMRATGEGEPLADLVVRSSRLRGIDVTAGRGRRGDRRDPGPLPGRGVASGTTRIRGAGELRHKESDRVAGIADGLVALGARVTVDGDDLEIDGGRSRCHGARRSSTHDDHRLAMTFAVAGLIGDGARRSSATPGSADVSYPGFFGELERVRA